MSTFWAELEDNHCPCLGSGWATINDECHECSIHYAGQLHPDSRVLLLDNPILLKEEERKSIIKWKIKIHQDKVKELTKLLQEAKTELFNLDLELINRTPTRKLEAVLDWSDVIFDGSMKPAIEVNNNSNKKDLR